MAVNQWIFAGGGVLIFLAFALQNSAGGLQRLEARAADLIEWKREEQQLRRAIGPVWKRLRDEFPDHRPTLPAAYQGVSLDELVTNAGWPDRPGHTAAVLGRFFAACVSLASLGGKTPAAQTRRQRAGPGTPPNFLVEDFLPAKDIVEIWAVALLAGGGRATALREVLRGLRRHHEDSLRLVWFLSVALAESQDWPVPTYESVRPVRDVMLSEGEA